MLELILYPTYILIRTVAERMLGFRKENRMTKRQTITILHPTPPAAPPPGFLKVCIICDTEN